MDNNQRTQVLHALREARNALDNALFHAGTDAAGMLFREQIRFALHDVEELNVQASIGHDHTGRCLFREGATA